MRVDYYQKYIEREWHADYKSKLDCPFVRIPYTATFVETVGDKWVILNTRYANGNGCFYSVMLKPARWMQMGKEDLPAEGEPLVGYTYNQDGPFGYSSYTLQLARERIKSLTMVEEPVSIEQPTVAVVESPVVVAEVPIEKKPKILIRDMSAKELREHKRQLRLARFAAKGL